MVRYKKLRSRNSRMSIIEDNELNLATGRHVMRPPNLNFKTISDTDNYTEYEITTNKNKKQRSGDNDFENYLESFIFCNPTMRIKMPKKKFMKKKDGENKFAYVMLMFPSPRSKAASYTDGCILSALGLRRQQVNADIICLVTPDIKQDVIDSLEIVYDKVITVPYITPFSVSENDIMINKDILKDCEGYDNLHPYSFVFTKLHIFNPEILPYEKVVFVDSDLVPLNYYDSLFTLNTPAGWVEYRKKLPYLESFNWDRCDALQHGEKIPKYMTDIDKKTGADVNAGLMVISPNKKEYDEIIKELQSPMESWFGDTKNHKGFYNMDFSESSVDGRAFVKSYCFPEQNYLTKRYSGKWTYLEFAFESWSLDPCNSFGIHMAGFNPKPWFRQPAGLAVKSFPEYEYTDLDALPGQGTNLPMIIADDDEKLLFENITYAYEMFNETMVWGLVNYPKLLKKDNEIKFLQYLKIYGTKISFGTDKFKMLDPKNEIEFMYIKDIHKDHPLFKKLSTSQKYISLLMNDPKKNIKKIKDNYLNICKSKVLKTYKEGEYDLQIVDYPNYVDMAPERFAEYLYENKMPVGKYKGKQIRDLPDNYVKSFIRKSIKNTQQEKLVKKIKTSKKKQGRKHAKKQGKKQKKNKLSTIKDRNSKSDNYLY